MSLHIIKKLFITLSFTIIFLIFASSLYTYGNNYSSVDAIIYKSFYIPTKNKKMYTCYLFLEYSINGNKITNQIIVNSPKPYQIGDTLDIDYNTKNFLNISLKSQYREISLFLSISALIFLVIFIILFREVTQDIYKFFVL